MKDCLALEPETFVADWHTLPRGAAIIENPLDIMFDYDDVVFPTMMSIHDLAREAGLHDGTVDPAWQGWEAYGCSEEVYWDLWSDFALSGGYTSTAPIPEAVEAMRRLYFAGHRIHIVTARGFMSHASDIRTWTREHVEEFAVPWHTLTFARDKVAAAARIFDSEWRTFDYAIDDSPKNIEALRGAGIKAYLLDHVHNTTHEYDMRVASVGDFADIILQEAPSE